MPATRVLIVATGGTIDSRRPSGSGSASVPSSATDGLVDDLAGYVDGVELILARWGHRLGGTLGPGDFLSIARYIEERSDRCDAVIVTAGTDTLEELAYALTCVLRIEQPIAVVGAMRRVGDPGADGVANLLDGIAAVRDPRVRRLSPVVVLGQQVVSAVAAVKADSTGLTSFRSEYGDRHGVISEGFSYSCIPIPVNHYVGVLVEQIPDVVLVWVASGSDGRLVEACLQAQQPVVIAGSGGGHVPPEVANAIASSCRGGIPVVVTTRCCSGPTLGVTYAGPGSETDLRQKGAVHAGLLSPLKARLRLAYGLAAGRSVTDLFPVDASGPIDPPGSHRTPEEGRV